MIRADGAGYQDTMRGERVDRVAIASIVGGDPPPRVPARRWSLAAILLGAVLGVGSAGCAPPRSVDESPPSSPSPALPSPAFVSVSAPNKPTRLISINPCIDAILKEVADPSQILAISRYSQEANATSVDLAWAHRFASTSGTAEEIIAAAPDLVFAGVPSAPHMVAALQRLGVPLVQIPMPETIAQSRQQIIKIARLIGQPQRAQSLLAAIDSAVARAESRVATRHRLQGLDIPKNHPQNPDTQENLDIQEEALIWQEGGLVPGAGSLADDLLRTAGYRNASRRYGLAKWDSLPLESLIAAPPSRIFTLMDIGAPSAYLGMHPALRRAVRAKKTTLSNYPRPLLYCGGPTIILALDRLSS